MRNLVYKDRLIPQKEYDQLLKEYGAFIKKHTGITPLFWTIDKDYTDYPTLIDSDGDDVVRPSFLDELVDETEISYGKFGADNIVTLIHQDHWKSGKTATRKGIWGTNYSYRFGNYHVQYCRFDKRNPANSFGTLNHEIDHTYDALIKVELDVDIHPILGVAQYDRDTTHGGKVPYKYIRYQENAAKLKILAPYLKAAYAKRQSKHDEYIKGFQFSAIGLLEKLVYLLQARFNRKNGVPKQ